VANTPAKGLSTCHRTEKGLIHLIKLNSKVKTYVVISKKVNFFLFLLILEFNV